MDAPTNDAPSDVQVDGGPMDALDAMTAMDAPDGADAGYISNLPGLVLWLDAAKGVTKDGQNQVSKWADQSGNQNDAQSMGNFPPVYVANGINALPALQLTKVNTGSLLQIADNASIRFGTGDFSITVVAEVDNTPSGNPDGFGVFYSKVDLNKSTGFWYAGNDVNAQTAGMCSYTGSAAPHATANLNGAPHTFGIRRINGMIELRGAGMVLASAASTDDFSTPGIPVGIGQNIAGGAGRLDGKIAEVVAVKGTLSDNDVAQLESFLKTKYKL